MRTQKGCLVCRARGEPRACRREHVQSHKEGSPSRRLARDQTDRGFVGLEDYNARGHTHTHTHTHALIVMHKQRQARARRSRVFYAPDAVEQAGVVRVYNPVASKTHSRVNISWKNSRATARKSRDKISLCPFSLPIFGKLEEKKRLSSRVHGSAHLRTRRPSSMGTVMSAWPVVLGTTRLAPVGSDSPTRASKWIDKDESSRARRQ